MPVKMEICEAGRVIHLTVSDPWTINDLAVFYPDENTLFSSATHKVHSLVDIRAMRVVPTGALSKRQSPNLTHPNSGQLVIIGASALAQSLAELACKLSRFERLKFFKSEDEAWAYLRRILAEDISAEESRKATPKPVQTEAATPEVAQ